MEFIQAKRSNDCRLRDILGRDRDLVVGLHQVDLREGCAASQASGEVLDMGYGIAVWYGSRVEGTIIATGPPIAVGLGDHIKRRRPVAGRQADSLRGKHLIELGFSSVQLFRCKTTNFGERRRVSGDDVMLDVMFGGWLRNARLANGRKLGENGVEVVGRLFVRHAVQAQWKEHGALRRNSEGGGRINEAAVGEVDQ